MRHPIGCPILPTPRPAPLAAAKRLDGSDLPREPFFRPGLWQNDLFLRT